MFVGVLRLTLQIPGARSLKDRRRVVRSFKDRLRAKLQLSVAEVGALDLHQMAVIGVAAVSNDAAQIDEMLVSAAAMAVGLPDSVLIDRALKIVSFGREGRGVGTRAPKIGREQGG